MTLANAGLKFSPFLHFNMLFGNMDIVYACEKK